VAAEWHAESSLFGVPAPLPIPKRHISVVPIGLWTAQAARTAIATGCGVSSGRLPPLGLRHQVFRGSDAVRAGLITPDQLRGSAYVRLFRNIYADASLEIDHRVRIDGAGLLLPSSAAIARRSAAAVAGITDVIGDDEPVEVIIEPGVVFGPFKGMRIRRAKLPAADVLACDPPRTTLLRAAVDIAREADRMQAVVALDRILHSGRITHEALFDAVVILPPCRGSALAGKAVGNADGRSESPPETLTRLLLIAAGLSPVPQYTVMLEGAFVARVDLAFVPERVAIEYEGSWHWAPGQLRRDRQRLDRLTAAGWRTVHVTAADLHRPQDMIARVRSVLALASA